MAYSSSVKPAPGMPRPSSRATATIGSWLEPVSWKCSRAFTSSAARSWNSGLLARMRSKSRNASRVKRMSAAVGLIDAPASRGAISGQSGRYRPWEAGRWVRGGQPGLVGRASGVHRAGAGPAHPGFDIGLQALHELLQADGAVDAGGHLASMGHQLGGRGAQQAHSGSGGDVGSVARAEPAQPQGIHPQGAGRAGRGCRGHGMQGLGMRAGAISQRCRRRTDKHRCAPQGQCSRAETGGKTRHGALERAEPAVVSKLRHG